MKAEESTQAKGCGRGEKAAKRIYTLRKWRWKAKEKKNRKKKKKYNKTKMKKKYYTNPTMK